MLMPALYGLFIYHAASAVFLVVAVEYFLIISLIGNAHVISENGLWRKVAYRHNHFLGLSAVPYKRKHAVGGVVALYPLKALRICVSLPKSRLLFIQLEKIGHILVEANVIIVLKHMPVYALLLVPFGILSNIVAHKEQFLAGIGVHKTVSRPQIGEFLPYIPGHLADHGAFHMHDLVM